ncbi:hypothetical protein HZF05_16750 [Sphingomonas sp. CGMCC 1.13654]|uniref:Uncharacterized protein n=1 Tax=Sphingomonas chungangi TaxID=2683589 RepID=A0A838LAK7_9SPHN|nr:hypothetical protein [Sphingomonas chungangi]MBA2935735.1 hypothetical protein [Sphingomonas chungangi]MVW54425.1 hypothetical protein [Sphingomonas chungangi]
MAWHGPDRQLTASVFAAMTLCIANTASTAIPPIVDSDEGPNHFASRPCGDTLCMAVQLNGVAEESDLPQSVGRFLIKLGKSLRGDGNPAKPGSDALVIAFNAYRIAANGSRSSIPWAVTSVSTREVAAARPADFEQALGLVHTIAFRSPEAATATRDFCSDPANSGPSGRFCRLVRQRFRV